MRITSVIAGTSTIQRLKPETTPDCDTSLGIAFVRRTGGIKGSTTVKDNYYVWEELYETAILETDDKKLHLSAEVPCVVCPDSPRQHPGWRTHAIEAI